LDVILCSNQPSKVVAGLELLNKLISNIIKDTTQEKFRNLKKTNKKIQEVLMSLQPNEKVTELLTIIGYVDIDDDYMAYVKTEDFRPLL